MHIIHTYTEAVLDRLHARFCHFHILAHRTGHEDANTAPLSFLR